MYDFEVVNMQHVGPTRVRPFQRSATREPLERLVVCDKDGPAAMQEIPVILQKNVSLALENICILR